MYWAFKPTHSLITLFEIKRVLDLEQAFQQSRLGELPLNDTVSLIMGGRFLSFI